MHSPFMRGEKEIPGLKGRRPHSPEAISAGEQSYTVQRTCTEDEKKKKESSKEPRSRQNMERKKHN